MAVDNIVLAIIIGTLAAIVYSLRVLVLMERRVAKMDYHIERIASKILNEELKIEVAEKNIKQKISSKKPTKQKVVNKKATKKKRK